MKPENMNGTNVAQKRVSKGDTEDMKVQQCAQHGAVDVRDHKNNIFLKNEAAFMPYVSMLAQLYFKFLNIEEGQGRTKREQRRKFVCNLLFIMLDHCEPQYYFYPLRALAEFFMAEESEKTLGKRLNA